MKGLPFNASIASPSRRVNQSPFFHSRPQIALERSFYAATYVSYSISRMMIDRDRRFTLKTFSACTAEHSNLFTWLQRATANVDSTGPFYIWFLFLACGFRAPVASPFLSGDYAMTASTSVISTALLRPHWSIGCPPVSDFLSVRGIVFSCFGYRLLAASPSLPPGCSVAVAHSSSCAIVFFLTCFFGA